MFTKSLQGDSWEILLNLLLKLKDRDYKEYRKFRKPLNHFAKNANFQIFRVKLVIHRIYKKDRVSAGGVRDLGVF